MIMVYYKLLSMCKLNINAAIDTQVQCLEAELWSLISVELQIVDNSIYTVPVR